MSMVSSLDIRHPIGGLFVVLGAMLAVYGAATGSASTGSDSWFMLNIDLLWGVVMLLFGAAMLVFAAVDHHATAEPVAPWKGD